MRAPRTARQSVHRCGGLRAHSNGSFDAVLDKVKKTMKLGTDRAHLLGEALY
jgi:hypothetical protein